MPLELFTALHHQIRHLVQKRTTNYRKPISSKKRLALTLSYLATGDSFATLEREFGVSEAAIHYIIPEVCRAIVLMLKDYIHTPNTTEEWESKANQFEERWNFPHCIGAVDGRHCPIMKPKFSGTEFHNYKHFFSVILMAVVDADYKFIYVDVGAQGKASDGGVFQKCSFNEDLQAGRLNLPQPKPLAGGIKRMPYVLVADDAFRLSVNIMKPYPGITDENSPNECTIIV